MKTKQDLLRRMKSEGACPEATQWVESRPEASARDIWLACDRVDWMCWLAFRGRPQAGARFACAEADIAIRVHAVNALRAAGLVTEADRLVALPVVTTENAAAASLAASSAASYAASYADDAAYAASRAASYAAASTDASRADERARQAKALHALWDGKNGLEGRL